MVTVEDLETRIWIWCGTLSGVCLILLFAIIGLCSKLNKLQGRIKSPSQDVPMREPMHSYGNKRIVPGEDLAKRGFSVHTPESEIGTTYFSDEVSMSPRSQSKDRETKNNQSKMNRQTSTTNSYYSTGNKSRGESNPNFIY